MNIKQLQTFVTVVKERSFTRAGEKLFLTQPAVSWQIKALENALGVQLLERQDRAMGLTAEGTAFYAYAVSLVNLYDQAINAIDEMKGLKRGSICVGASTIPGEYLLPSILGGFHARYPGLGIHLQVASTAQVVDRLLSLEVDLAVIGAPMTEEALALQPVYRDHLVAVVAPSHALAARRRYISGDVTSFPLVMRERGSGTRMVLEERLLAAGIETANLQVVMELATTRAVISAVEAGLGVSWVSSLAAEASLKLGRVVPLEVAGMEIDRFLYLASVQGRQPSQAAMAFSDFLQQYAFKSAAQIGINAEP